MPLGLGIGLGRLSRNAIAVPASWHDVVRDSFTRANGALVGSIADTGQTWLTGGVAKDFVVDTNAAKVGGGTLNISVIDGGLTNCRVMTTWTAGASIGLTLRYVDASNYSFVALFAASLFMADVVAGVPTAMAGSPVVVTAAIGDTLMVELAAASVKAYQNGNQIASTSSIRAASATKHGLYVASGLVQRGDDFKIQGFS